MCVCVCVYVYVHTIAVYKKTQSRLFFLRRLLRSFDICNVMLRMFYLSIIASVPTFHWIRVCCVAALIWFCSAIRQSPLVESATAQYGRQLASRG